MGRPNRRELVALVRQVFAACGSSEEEVSRLLQELERKVPGAPWSDTIFWPYGIPHPPGAKNLTPEEVVDRALAYEPKVIILPPPSAAE